MKLRIIAGAVALVMAGAANAAIDNGNQPGTDNGELFFSIWDNTNKTSYTADLNVYMRDFLAAPVFSSTNLSGLGAYVATADQAALSWNVGAMAQVNDVTFANQDIYGAFTTTNRDLATVLNQTTDASIPQMLINGRGYINAVNVADLNSDNDGVVTSVAADSDRYADSPNYGKNWGGAAPTLDTTAGLGGTLKFYQMNLAFDEATFSEFGVATEFAGTWSLDGTTGALAFGSTAAPAPVPLPPALWLLGSAMVGLVGVTRRRKVTV